MEHLAKRHTALLIIDMQNDAIDPKGKFASSGTPDHQRMQNAIANVQEIASSFREAGMPVVHVHHVVNAGGLDGRQNAPLFRMITEAGGNVRGSWGARPVEGLEPQSGDFVVEKQRMNGFYDSDLDTKLRGLGADKIVVTGAWTNFAVEHTCRHGADAGYEVVLVGDATVTMGEEWQNAAVAYALSQIVELVTTGEVVQAAQNAPA